MPNVRTFNNRKTEKYALEVPNEHFQIDGEILYCSASESVSIERFLVVQHIRTIKHKESKIRKQKVKLQFFASTILSGNKNLFDSDICPFFIHVDIPISKLENVIFKYFIIKVYGTINS